MVKGSLVAEAPCVWAPSVSEAPKPSSLWFGKALHSVPGSGQTLPPALNSLQPP